MDPWADSSAAWAPSETTKPASPKPAAREAAQLSDGPVDPWAESSHASVAIVPSYNSRSGDIDDEPQPGNDFDPWGGNAAPMAPLSTDVTIDNAHEATQDIRIDENDERKSDEGWNPTPDQAYGAAMNSGAISSSPQEQESDAQVVAVDEDDPWGSGAAAQRIKSQYAAQAAAQQMEILRLQEEAKGTRMDDVDDDKTAQHPMTVPEAAPTKVEESVVSAEPAASAPVVSGWRSIFSKAGANVSPASIEQKGTKEATKVDTAGAKETSESKDSPRSSTSIAAPRLWQASTILGNHTRSASNASRSSSIVEAPSSTKGPGWEITTKKPPPSGSGGGFMQSIFGAASTSANADNKSVITATKKEEKKTGLNRFGRGLQPPPVVSAADEEYDSFDASETGIEWDSSNAFEDQKKKPDLLSDDGEVTATGSTMGKLLGKLRGRNAQTSEIDKSNDMSKADLSWLENVGEGSKSTANDVSNGNADLDWLAFINDKTAAAAAAAAAAATTTNSKTVLKENSIIKGPKVQLVSSTSRGIPAAKIPPLAPPPSSSRTSSPFSLSSTASSKAQQNVPQSKRGNGDFDQTLLDDVASPNLDSGYRDDFTDNNASLLNGRPAPPDRKTSSFMRSFQGRPSKGKYDYDEDEEEGPGDTWSAFRDEPQAKEPYRDVDREIKVSPLPVQANIGRTRSAQGKSTTVAASQSTSISPPPPTGTTNQTWNRNGPLLAAPPGRPSSVGLVKQNSMQSASAASSPSSKPATKVLSQGKTLTNDDLSFFENL